MPDAMNLSISSRIDAFNQGRDLSLLTLKYQKMAENAFVFYRGSCHLFYEDWHQAPIELHHAPRTWVCGDLHLENFGSYRGGNGLTYFDINDFDESVLAPCSVDVVRFIVSLYLWATVPNTPIQVEHVKSLATSFLHAYRTGLQDGKALWVERDTAQGLVQELLEEQQNQQRKSFLKKRTQKQKGHHHRTLRIRSEKTRKISQNCFESIAQQLTHYAQTFVIPEDWADWAIEDHLDFFQILDIAERIAGTGSLGLCRYVVLLEGEGWPHHCLLDLKIERPSAIARSLDLIQPNFANEADRIVTAQHYLQAITPAFLDTLTVGSDTYMLREYQPTAAKLNLTDTCHDDWPHLMRTLGRVLAWAHLRSSGRSGSAIADELIEFANHADSWQTNVLAYAHSYSQTVIQDWQAFKSTLALSPAACEYLQFGC